MVKAEPHAVPGAPGQAQVQCPPLGGVLFGPQALRLCYCLSLPALPESVSGVGKVKLFWGESPLGGGSPSYPGFLSPEIEKSGAMLSDYSFGSI